MDFNLFARVAKLVALFGFLLPWVVVSCNGTELLSATGVQLMTGDAQPAGPLAGQDASETDSDPSILAIGVFAVIVVGLIVSGFSRARSAAMAMLASSVTAIGLAFYTIENMRGEMQNEIAKQGQSAEAQMIDPAQIASLIVIEEQRGFWVTIIALGIAALLCALALAPRTMMQTPAAPPADPPPA